MFSGLDKLLNTAETVDINNIDIIQNQQEAKIRYNSYIDSVNSFYNFKQIFNEIMNICDEGIKATTREGVSLAYAKLYTAINNASKIMSNSDEEEHGENISSFFSLIVSETADILLYLLQQKLQLPDNMLKTPPPYMTYQQNRISSGTV